ncbi:hypothetical protein CHU32_06115 [Superficieibacter electus]|uniref:DUF3239 domain-containing protein n=1 Tax=Superficieibacter electus TaxID=2022662 RepID=A0A2P5GTC4_9ENTR|nr:DUF3239 domain-containing protein [Superficieibacter electus]POP46329.1 hypothetical protein CHU33_06100 [Superficieibacter electus]POP49799.1 hypothetical protein CHU32_06115 [Superficieibacter electus]
MMDNNRQDENVQTDNYDPSLRPTTYAGQGPQFMGWAASRHFYYDVDLKLARRYNENYKGERKMIIGLVISALITGSLSIWLFSLGGIGLILLGIVAAVIGLLSILMAFIGIKRAATPTALLKRGVLNAGIVAQIDPDGVGILVLAETTENTEIHWGLCSVKFKELPPVHNRKIGERVPVTCAYGAAWGKEYCTSIMPSLIAWGTDSREVIQQAINAISETEWNALEKSIEQYDFKPEYSDEEQLRQLTAEEMIGLSLINRNH